MALPAFSASKHDVGINGVGFMAAPGGEGRISRQDLAPATAQSAEGEGRSQTYETEAFNAPADWEGGAGAARSIATDMYATGKGDGSHGGQWYPARKRIPGTAGHVAATLYYLRYESNLYGFTSAGATTIGTASIDAYTAPPVSQPIRTASNIALFTTATGTIVKAPFGTTVETDVTPSGAFIEKVERYGKWLFAFGYDTASSEHRVYYTDDHEPVSADWTALPNDQGTNFPTVLNTLAALGKIWFTTDEGLYVADVSEHNYEDKTTVIKFAAAQVLTFDYHGSGKVGTRLRAYEGAVYTNVGATLFRYVEGNPEQQPIVWPPPGWGTVGGDIQDIIIGGGSMWFGAGGYLWRYNGRGFHPVASEPYAGAYDVLAWHDGRIYMKSQTTSDPASYYQIGYGAVRPDAQAGITQDHFETGYLVESMTDFGKISAKKVGRLFETQTKFHGTGSTDAEAGYVDVHYLVDPTSADDPARLGGGATAAPWVLAGRHSVTHGYHKKHLLATPFAGQRLWRRLTVVPGTTGYPIPEGDVAYARAIMPSLKRIVANLRVATDTEDGDGAQMYDDDDAVKEAVGFLLGLREDDDAIFTVNYVDTNDEVTDYVCTMGPYVDSLIGLERDDWSEFLVTLQMDELPK